jgi:hypothetical protein
MAALRREELPFAAARRLIAHHQEACHLRTLLNLADCLYMIDIASNSGSAYHGSNPFPPQGVFAGGLA